MKIIRRSKLKRIVIPQSEIRYTDPLNEIVLLSLKLFKITDICEYRLLIEKFKLREQQARTLFQKMIRKQFIEKTDNGYRISETGIKQLDNDEIVEIRPLDLRIELLDNPFQVLNHTFYSYPESPIIEQEITSDKIWKNREEIGLDSAITKLGERIFTYTSQEVLCWFIFDDSDDFSDVKVDLPYGTKSIPMENSLLPNLRSRVTQLRNNDNQMVERFKAQFQLNLDFTISKSHENYVLEIEDISIPREAIISLYHYLVRLIEEINEEDSFFKYELNVFEEWFIDMKFQIKTENSQVMHTLFCLFLLKYKSQDLIISEDFHTTITDYWIHFINIKSLKPANLDFKLLFDILWDSELYPETARLLASKLFEEDYLKC